MKRRSLNPVLKARRELARQDQKAQETKYAIRQKVKDRRVLLREFGHHSEPLAAEFRDNKDQRLFLCWWVVNISNTGGALGLSYVEIGRFRLKQINQCIKLTAEAHEAGKLSQEDLETVLDYLYAELNKRLNRTEKKLE